MIRFGRDFERLGPGLIGLATAFLFWLLILGVSHGVDRPPVIRDIKVQPPRVVRGATALVRAEAEDPDGRPLQYEFAAESGKLEPKGPTGNATSKYSPAAVGSIADRITVSVTDAAGLKSALSKVVTIEAAEAPAEATPAAPATGNHAPILNGGGTFYQTGGRMITLEATGSDPDGDKISFAWDFGTCLGSANIEISHADAKLLPACQTGKAVLTWTDEHGASATAEWTLQR